MVMSQPSILGLRGRLAGLLEVSRLFHAFGSLRGFRADATDPEARGSNNSEEQSCASSSTQQPLSGRAQPTSLSAHTSDTPAPNNRGPIRAVQPRKGERRKVLPVLQGDKFTSNVATLLLRWPQAAQWRQLRSWQDVCDSDRFQHLFPRRPGQLSSGPELAMRASEATGAYKNADAVATGDKQLSDAQQQYDAHQEVLLELVERLQLVQQHLQDSMMEDESSNSIIALAVLAEEEEYGGFSESEEKEEQPFAGTSNVHSDTGRSSSSNARTGRSKHGYCGQRGVQDEGTLNEKAAAVTSIGRRQRRPEGCQRGPRPAPPWDDTQPFQTHVGTVYHFWRLCPYG